MNINTVNEKGENTMSEYPEFKKNPTIESNFSYHAPKDNQPAVYEAIRNKAKDIAYYINEVAPDSREKSLAMIKLEEAVMWANAAIARN